MKAEKDHDGNVLKRHSAVVDNKQKEIRFLINGKKFNLTFEEYEILKEIQKDMIR
ncbi:hypothetical protein [Chryseobacterium caseinilyticum]|uniref:Uncharacterized protein n=1 Tax=Chryseobacterium caseinilyticum TaxID=2771428 RepID=A0ABR8Z749_9FLAO|nr:hypothetical protein [Chryseobacterium caseinilyticum]MBD8081124.1 hypothetical protein [Chryseobacterium caseinilyticum]